MSEPGIIFLLEDGRLAGPHIYVARLFKYLPGKNKVLIPKDSEKAQKIFDSNSVNYQEIFFLSRLSREPFRIIKYFFFFIPEIFFLTVHFLRSKEKVIYCAGGSWQIKGAICGFLSGKVVIWHLNDTYVPKIIKVVFNLFSSLANGYIYASEASKKYYLLQKTDTPASYGAYDDSGDEWIIENVSYNCATNWYKYVCGKKSNEPTCTI